jgi:hypothetical protein
MSKIDELSGVELDRSVARALGFTPEDGNRNGGGYWHDTEGVAWFISERRRDPVYIGKRLATFSPHSNNAQAFNLGISLFWYFEEYHGYIEAQCSDGASVYRARADYANDDEKATAYATARCRAWLKAEAGEESPNV